MQPIREIAKAIISEMENVQSECDPESAKYYERLATITFADFLKRSPFRSQEMNQQCLEETWIYVEKAISMGIPEIRIEKSFDRLRSYWLPRLKEESNAKS